VLLHYLIYYSKVLPVTFYSKYIYRVVEKTYTNFRQQNCLRFCKIVFNFGHEILLSRRGKFTFSLLFVQKNIPKLMYCAKTEFVLTLKALQNFLMNKLTL
jgi:hypothetical protein